MEPTKEQFKKIQQCELEIMDEIHRICVKHGITYSLIYGSMMGAVLYKGFIPWDDDIDIVFMRDQYELFEAACSSELDTNRFFFQSVKTEEEYIEPGLIKIRRNDTLLLEGADAHRNIHHGAWVDITLMENCDGNIRKVRKCKKYFGLWRDKYYYKSAVEHLNFKGLVYQTMRRISPPFTIRRTAKKFDALCQYCLDSNSKFLFHPFSYQDDIYPRDWMKDYVLMPFEGREYMCFKRADEILRVRFPNYTPDYPKEKQHTTHGFLDIKI